MYPPRATYYIPFTVTNPTTAPFLQLATPNNSGLAIVEFWMGQQASEVSEQVLLTVARRSTASTLPTAASILKADPSAPTPKLASSTTTNAYGIASATGTLVETPIRYPFNMLNGVHWPPVPEGRFFMDISQFLTFQLLAAFTGTIDGTIVVAEV